MKQEIINVLSNLIREKGYASLSIADIAKATDLSKSSLYHHFPGGKVEMAQSVLDATCDMLYVKFTDCLENHAPGKAQLVALLKVLDEFYDSGEKNCLVDVMSVAPTDPGIQKYLDKIISALLHTFASILKEMGLNKKAAESKAIIFVSLLQGGLVLSRASQNADYFKHAVKEVLRLYVRV